MHTWGNSGCSLKQELNGDCLWHGPISPSELWMGPIPQVFAQAHCQMLPPCGEMVWADAHVPYRFVSSKSRALIIQSTHRALVLASGSKRWVRRWPLHGLVSPSEFCIGSEPRAVSLCFENTFVFLKLFSLNMVSFTVLLLRVRSIALSLSYHTYFWMCFRLQ